MLTIHKLKRNAPLLINSQLLLNSSK